MEDEKGIMQACPVVVCSVCGQQRQKAMYLNGLTDRTQPNQMSPLWKCQSIQDSPEPTDTTDSGHNSPTEQKRRPIQIGELPNPLPSPPSDHSVLLIGHGLIAIYSLHMRSFGLVLAFSSAFPTLHLAFTRVTQALVLVVFGGKLPAAEAH